MITKRTVCLRLDSLPGSVKCYVRNTVENETTETTEKIAIYKNRRFESVAPDAVNDLLSPSDRGLNIDLISDSSDTNDIQGEKLCNLFKEAVQ